MKTKILALSTVVTGAVLSASAHAGTTAEELATAVATGQSNVSLVVSGLVGLAALGFGVTMIVRFLGR